MKNETPEWLAKQLDIVEKTVDFWSPAKQEWAGREKPKYPKIEKKLYKVWDNDKQ